MQNKKGFTLVEIMIVVVIIGLLAAMAIPAFNKVRATSQDKAILNNIRQIASAAQQYMLDSGKTTVDYTHVVGVGLYVSSVTAVAGEDYTTINIGTDTTRITLSNAAGRTVTYDF